MDPKTEILYRYPLPIAVTYLNADNAREAVGAHDQRLKLFEVTLKYLSSIAIAQYLHDRLEDPRVKQALRGLARPSLGQWNGFLREVLSAYSRAGRLDGLFVTDLPDAYNKKRRDRPAMAKAYNEITNFVQGRTDSASTSLSVRQFCDAMINYRNKTVGHGLVTRYHCEQINELLFDALEEMLTQLGFLKQHRLVYIEDVRVRRGSYAHEMMSFMGSTPPSRMKEAYVAENQDEYRFEEQLYLCVRDENVPVLSLHPLIIAWQGDVLFLNESAHERGIEYLSYQSGQIKKPDRLLEDFKEILGFVLSDDRPEASFERIRQQAMAPPDAVPDPFAAGQEALAEEDWAAALDALAEVAQDSEYYAEAQEGIAKAKQQQNWLERYKKAQALMDERQWDQAQETIDALLQEAGEYRDARGLLQTIRVERAQEESLQRLYEYAQDALQTAQWERAYDLLNRIHELRSDFRDVSALLAQQKRLHEFYDQAIEAMSDRRWVEAQALLRQLEALEPGYKNLATLLERAEQELETEAQLASLYSEARSHMALEEWEQALDALDQIHDLQEDYRDVPDLIAQVQNKVLIPCPQCGTMTPSGHKFCGKCGAPIKAWVCWRCQSPVPERRKFCGRCGAPRIQGQVVTCPRCGNENAVGRKFCGRCGYALAQE
jgi:hypothetical protein